MYLLYPDNAVEFATGRPETEDDECEGDPLCERVVVVRVQWADDIAW